jgi:hypothetical protein
MSQIFFHTYKRLDLIYSVSYIRFSVNTLNRAAGREFAIAVGRTPISIP